MTFQFILLYLWFTLSNLVGRELFGQDAHNIKYIYFGMLLFVIFLNWKKYFCRLNNIKVIYVIVVLALVATVRGYAEGNQGILFNNIMIFGLFFYVIGYFYIDTDEKLEHFIKFNIACFILLLLAKEIMFHKYGVSIIFGSNDLRDYGLIRKSSDTINSLGLIALIYSAASKNKFKIIICAFIIYVLYRYGIRSSFVALFVVVIYQLITYLPLNMKRKINRLIPVISILLLVTVLIKWADIQYTMEDEIRILSYKGVDQSGTFIWRLSMWYDTFNTIFDNQLYLIGKVGKEVEFILTRHAYVNPHNSYIYALVNYGLLTMVLIVIIPLRTLFYKNNYCNQSKLNKITASILIMYMILSLSTPIFELSYQGCTFWFFVGAYQNLKERNEKR